MCGALSRGRLTSIVRTAAEPRFTGLRRLAASIWQPLILHAPCCETLSRNRFDAQPPFKLLAQHRTNMEAVPQETSPARDTQQNGCSRVGPARVSSRVSSKLVI